MGSQNTISLVGLNFRTANLAQMEMFQIPRKSLSKALLDIKSNVGVDGVVILSTCNRTEFYLSTSGLETPEKIIFAFYAKYLPQEIDKRIFYIKTDAEAVRHLFRVVSGLDSLILGEYQIQGQSKEAYSIACQAKTVDRALHKLFHSAFRCGKQIRSETSIGEGRQSVSGFASEIAIKTFETSATVMIIGANESAKIFATELKKAGFQRFIFLNRTVHKAQELAVDFGGNAFPLTQIAENLVKADIIFSSTSAPIPIIPSKIISDSFYLSGNPKLILDLAIPRDIEADGIPDTIQYFNIEKLKELLEKEQNRKLHDLPICDKIIETEVQLFSSWSNSVEHKIFEPYQEKFEKIRLEIIEEYRNQFSEETIEKIDKITRQLLHRTQAVFVSILKKEG